MVRELLFEVVQMHGNSKSSYVSLTEVDAGISAMIYTLAGSGHTILQAYWQLNNIKLLSSIFCIEHKDIFGSNLHEGVLICIIRVGTLRLIQNSLTK